MSLSPQQDEILIRYLAAGTMASLHEEIVKDKASFNLEASLADLFNQGYELLESDLPQGDFETSLQKRIYTVYLRERMTVVFPSQPKAEGEAVQGYQGLVWPAGLTEADLKRTFTRTISYRYEDGGEAFSSVTETVDFERTALVNHVTNAVTYMPWQVLGAAGFKEVKTPEILGYKANQERVEASGDLLADGEREIVEQVDVVFERENQVAKLIVLDKTTGQVLLEDELSGLTNDRIDYPISDIIATYLARGYDVITNPLEEPAFFGGSAQDVQTFTLVLKAKEVEVSSENKPRVGTPVYPELTDSVLWPTGVQESYLTKAVKRTLLNQHEDGTLIEAIEQRVEFSRTARVNLLTKEVLYTPWKLVSEQTGFDAYTPEERVGYIPRPRHIPAISHVDPDSSDLRVIITYARKIQRVTVQFIDKSTDNLILHQAQLVGKTGELLNFDYQQKVQEFLNNGYEVVETDYPTEEARFMAETTESPVYTVWLMPKVVVVLPEEPKAAGSYIDEKAKSGPKWPVGVDEQYLRRLVTRTTYFRHENGKDALPPRIDGVLFQRQAEINLVTGQVSYSDWSHQNNRFEEIAVPQIAGYVSNRQTIAAIDNVGVESANFDVTVYYIKSANQLDCQIVDVTDDRILETISLTVRSIKKIREEIDRQLNPYFAKGYELKRPELLTLALKNPDLTTLKVELAQKVIEVAPEESKVAHSLVPGYAQVTWPAGLEESYLNKEIYREIRLAYDQGGEVEAPIRQFVRFKRSAQFNLVTNEVTYGEWASESKSFEAVSLPEIAGYSPRLSQVAEEEVSENSLNQVLDVIYYAQPKQVVINYIDDETEELIVSDRVIGAIGEEIPYVVVKKHHFLGLLAYQVVKVSCPSVLTITQEEQVYEVRLRAKWVTVDWSKPHSPYTTEEIDGYGVFAWPSGLDKEDLVSQITRRIFYKDQEGKDLLGKALEQEVVFTRQARVNLVTSEVAYGDWESDNPRFDALTSQEFPGYTPEVNEIPSLEVSDLASVSDRVIDLVVIYHKEPYLFNVLVINEISRQIIKEFTLSVASAEEVESTLSGILDHYQKQGYSLVTDLPNVDEWQPGAEETVTVGLRPQLLTITAEDIQDDYANLSEEIAEQLRLFDGLSLLELQRQVVRKIHYIYPNGRAVAPTYIDTVIFKRAAKINLVTSEIFYEDWTSYYPVFDEVLSPICEGYTASKEIVESIEELTADSQNIVETVLYTRNIQQVIVNVIDKSTGNVIYAESITGTNADQSRAYNMSQFVQKGQHFVSQETIGLPYEAETQVVSDVVDSNNLTYVSAPETPLPVLEAVVEIHFGDQEALDRYGVNANDLVRTCVRVVDFTFEDGASAGDSIRQELTYYRTALVNPDTKKLTYTDWLPLERASFDEINPPKLTGYETIPQVVSANEPDLATQEPEHVLVRYQKIVAENIEIVFVDNDTKKELMNFNFTNKGPAYSERKIDKGTSFLSYKGYQVVSSDYPDNGNMVNDTTERFEIRLSQQKESQLVEDVKALVEPIQASSLSLPSSKEEVAAKVSQEPLPASETILDSETLGDKKTKKKKGLFSFLFDN